MREKRETKQERGKTMLNTNAKTLNSYKYQLENEFLQHKYSLNKMRLNQFVLFWIFM